MVLTQNSLVVHTNELDALETGTYKNNAETVLCGSSMCRPKTSLSKIKQNSKDALESDYFLNIQGEKTEALNASDMPQFSHFERETPLSEFKNKRYAMSRRTKTKIRQKITAWARTERPKNQSIKFVFITLTLTSNQRGTDKDYSKMLNTFFNYLRKYYGFDNYLYVNERQTKTTDNIHTHIIHDRYLPVAQINAIWCKILRDNGYTFTPVGSDTPIYDFKAGKGGANPVDVSFVYDVKRVSSYITKYITKNESEFDTLIWNCSNNISRLFTSVKIYQKEVFYSLFSQTLPVVKAKLTNGDVLHIHLLSLYHGLQKKHFKINEQVLTGSLNREKFINQIKEQCRLKALQLA